MLVKTGALAPAGLVVPCAHGFRSLPQTSASWRRLSHAFTTYHSQPTPPCLTTCHLRPSIIPYSLSSGLARL